MMIITERIESLKNNGFIVTHKLIGDEKLLDDDWIRIRKYHSDPNIYSDFLFTCDRKDVDTLQKELMEKPILKEEVWLIGGIMTLDLFVE